MFRIQRTDDGEHVVVTVSGRIATEHLHQLQQALVDGSGRDIVLDLQDVNLVDEDVVRFLARHEAAGATLTNCPAYIREWITLVHRQ